MADSYGDTVPDCDCAMEHRQLAGWLDELLEIKKARLSVEVFMQQGYDIEPEESELPLACPHCGSKSGLVDRGGRLTCPACGRVGKEQSQI